MLRCNRNFLALFGCGLWHLLRLTNWRHGLAMLWLWRTDIIAPSRRQSPRYGRLLRHRNLFALFSLRNFLFRLHALLLLRRLINRRSLIPALVIRLLISALLIPARGSGRLAALIRGALVALRIVIVSHSIRTRRLAYHVAHGTRREIFAGSPLNRVHARASIGINCSLVPVKIHRLTLEIFDHLRAINDCGVVHN